MIYVVAGLAPRCGAQLVQRCMWACGVQVWGNPPTREFDLSSHHTLNRPLHDDAGNSVFQSEDAKVKWNTGRLLPMTDSAARPFAMGVGANGDPVEAFDVVGYTRALERGSSARYGFVVSDWRIDRLVEKLEQCGVEHQVVVCARPLAVAESRWANPRCREDAWKFQYRDTYRGLWRANASWLKRNGKHAVEFDRARDTFTAVAAILGLEPNGLRLNQALAHNPTARKTPHAPDGWRR